MSILKSYKSKAAIAEEAVYGIASETQGDYEAVRLVSENIMQTSNYVKSQAKFGYNGMLEQFIESYQYGGTIVIELDYTESLSVLKAMAGAGTADLDIDLNTPAAGYTTTAIPLSEEYSQSYSLLLDKGGEGNALYVGGKVLSASIKIAGGATATLELEMVFKELGDAASPALTIPAITETELMTLADVVFRVSAGAEETLDSGDEYKISSFTMSLAWNMLSDALVSGGLILEPIPNTARELTVEIESPEYDDASTELLALRTAKRSGTAVTMDIKFTTQEVGDDYGSLMLEFPRSKVTEGFEGETTDEIMSVSGTINPYRAAGGDAGDTEMQITYVTKD